MNHILTTIKQAIEANMTRYLPQVKREDLENNGAVYYMNGKDGTEFDWYVNDKLPPFMVFYNDEANMGAARLLLFCDGAAVLYLYGENGKRLLTEVPLKLDVEEAEVFALAVLLKNAADEKAIWDEDIEVLAADEEPDDSAVAAFRENQKHYADIRKRKELLNRKACVSGKITEEGWKVGYMVRNEPHEEEDSGWLFLAGDEDEAYLSDYRNLVLMPVGAVWQMFDPDIFGCIDMPVGTRMIRISPDRFEIDKNDKDIYMAKRPEL